MPNFIAGLILPFITSSPIFFDGPASGIIGVPKGATDRAAFLDQITSTQPGSSAGKAIKLRGLMLLRAVRLNDGVPDDQIEVEEVPPDPVPFERMGACLAPLIDPSIDFWPDLDASTVSPGDLVVATWRGTPWSVAKVYLGRVGDDAVFYQSNPAFVFETPLSLITHGQRIRHEPVTDALPAEVHAIMAGLDDRSLALPNAGSVSNGLAIVVSELFDAMRALPEATAPVTA